MRCTGCAKGKLKSARTTESLDVAGHTFKGEVSARRCSNCGELFLDAGSLAHLELRAAAELAKAGENAGDALKFMRKALGLRAAELAELLDVAPETVSRWETEARPPDRRTFALLASLVLDKAEGLTTTLDRLRSLGHPSPLARTVRLAPA